VTAKTFGLTPRAAAPVLALTALTLLVAPAAARDVPTWKPLPVAGMQIVYGFSKGSDTTHVITKVDGDDVWNTVRSQVDGAARVHNNITFRSILTWQLHREGAGILRWKFDRKKLASLWPLKVGNQVTVKADLYLGRGATFQAAEKALKLADRVVYRFRVEGRRHVTVPGGTWQSWIILRIAEQRGLDGKLKYVSVRRYWLAERLGWIVRMDSNSIAADAKQNSTALLRAKAVALPAKKN